MKDAEEIRELGSRPGGEASSEQILQESGEILSCGGAFFPRRVREVIAKKREVQILHLPNHSQESIVFENSELSWRIGQENAKALVHSGKTFQKFLSRYFKDGQN